MAMNSYVNINLLIDFNKSIHPGIKNRVDIDRKLLNNNNKK